jgi:hypothetical protein
VRSARFGIDRGERHVKLRTRVLAAAGALAMVGGAAAFVAPTANAVLTTVGSCKGALTLNKITPPLGDQTTVGTKIAGALMKDETTLAVVGGKCVGAGPPAFLPVRPGDPHIPQPSGDLHPKTIGVALLGNASCASGATAQAADANSAAAWPEAGTVSYTFSETYTDIITLGVHNYTMKSNISLLGFNPSFADVVDLGGVNVNSGVGAGLTVSGSVWEDPVVKNDSDVTDIYNVGYELNAGAAFPGCFDGVVGNASIPQVESGGGGTTSTSLAGTTGVPGITFTAGE